MNPAARAARTAPVDQTLTPCLVCGKSHRPGSGRSERCSGSRQHPAPPRAPAPPPRVHPDAIQLGPDLSRYGQGVRLDKPTLPHAVFTRQMLPSDVLAPSQPKHEQVPASTKETQRLVSLYRCAARAAVNRWRACGVEPTASLMSDMDVYDEEIAVMLEAHGAASRASWDALKSSGLSVPAYALDEATARRQCVHALRTMKGLAVSPTNLQRLLVRALPGEDLSAKEMMDFAVKLRALSLTHPQIERFLAAGSDELNAEHVRPVLNLLSNLAARAAGRIRVEGDAIAPEATRQWLVNLSVDDVAQAQAHLDAVAANAQKLDPSGGPYRLSVFEPHQDAFVLGSDFAARLEASGLDYTQWRAVGWSHALNDPDSTRLVLFDPAAVKLRQEGHPDSLIAAFVPALANADSPSYEFAPGPYLRGEGFLHVAGMSSLGAQRFGIEESRATADQLLRVARRAAALVTP